MTETCKLCGTESTPREYIDVLDGHVWPTAATGCPRCSRMTGRCHGPTCLRCTEPKRGGRRTCREAGWEWRRLLLFIGAERWEKAGLL